MKYTLDWLINPDIPTTESMRTIWKPMQTIPL